MSLPADFAVSAAALECYRYCPRRFKQRYLDGIPLPEVDLREEPTLRRGQLFHRLALWESLGMPVEPLIENEADPELERIWESYQSSEPVQIAEPDARVERERLLSVRIDGQRVVARIDALIRHSDGRITIIDWKTGRSRPAGELQRAEQTRLYPLAVWEHFASRAHGPQSPEMIRLLYWFPDRPGDPVEIAYSSEQLEIDREWLAGKLAQIAADEEFALTTDRSRCAKCGYAAHCGVIPEPGDAPYLDEPDLPPDWDSQPLWLADQRLG